MNVLRRRKGEEPIKAESSDEQRAAADPKPSSPSEKRRKKKASASAGWQCLDTCCWMIGWVSVSWWAMLVLYYAMPSLPQYVHEVFNGPPGDPPGLILKREGLKAKHPVVFVPGIVTGGLELWEGRPCAEGLFRKRLWGGTFGEVYKRPLCWVDHMSLDNETGLDPQGVRVRPVSGLVAADYFAPGYFVWAVLIENLAQLGYEEKSMHMAAYDWRLSFQNTEVRDKSLSRLKSTIELMVRTNDGNKVVAVPHSMGVLYFLHFMKWVEAPLPMGGGGGPDWCAKNIKSILNLGGPLLGCPKTISVLFSGEAKDIAVARAIAPGVMDSELFGLHTLQHIMRMMRSWDSTMSMIPKGGEIVWGGLDWSPEEDFDCSLKKYKEDGMNDNVKEMNASRAKTYQGRMLSFGKEASEIESSALISQDLKDQEACKDALVHNNVCCGDIWTEYHELSRKCIEGVANRRVYTAGTIPELLRLVAPKLMQRGDTHFSHGIADDLNDPKYQHYKHWSNPLETKFPNAPDIEIFCMYGVGVLTERSYIYKVSPETETCYIPFRIDTFAQGDTESCLKGGVQFVDGDESVPVLSSGFMCAKGWRGKTRFNPSGASTFLREYKHSPPSNILEGRGTHSASHVDMLGNFALIEDILRVAAGATGEDIGGERVYSDIFKWSERVALKV